MTLLWVILMLGLVVGVVLMFMAGALISSSSDDKRVGFLLLILSLLALGFGCYYLYVWNKATVGEPRDLFKNQTYKVCGQIPYEQKYLVIIEDPATKKLYCTTQSAAFIPETQFVLPVKPDTNLEWRLEWVEPTPRKRGCNEPIEQFLPTPKPPASIDGLIDPLTVPGATGKIS